MRALHLQSKPDGAGVTHEIEVLYERNGVHNLALISRDKATGQATVIKMDLANREMERLAEFIERIDTDYAGARHQA